MDEAYALKGDEWESQLEGHSLIVPPCLHVGLARGVAFLTYGGIRGQGLSHLARVARVFFLGGACFNLEGYGFRLLSKGVVRRRELLNSYLVVNMVEKESFLDLERDVVGLKGLSGG